MVSVALNAGELAVLYRQHPSTKSRGGWQSLLVGLQQKVNRSNGRLTLTQTDLERLSRYAFEYGNGGWESRLRSIFGRTLGPNLGRQFFALAA